MTQQQGTQMELLTQLREALARHDWYYNYSDDYSVYRRGSESADRIRDLRRQCTAAGLSEQAEALYDAAANKPRKLY
jgi:hypothetical protein